MFYFFETKLIVKCATTSLQGNLALFECVSFNIPLVRKSLPDNKKTCEN